MNENLRARLVARALAAVVVIAAIGGLGACGVNKKEIATARSSVYDAEFAVVYSATVQAVRALYPSLDEDPGTGTIKTAWHQVKYTDPGADDPKSVQARDKTAGAGGSSQNSLGYNPARPRRNNFIRFEIHVAGGRPWRVRVIGTASEIEPGNALPTELKGAAKPHWLAGRTDALIVSIHRRLTAYARPAPALVEEVEVETPRAAIKGDIPEGARAAVAAVAAALEDRAYDKLRALCAADVMWSLGASPGVDGAMAMWQADPQVFGQMGAAIAAGCAKDGADVVCPGAAARGAAQLRVAQRNGAWKLAAFVALE